MADTFSEFRFSAPPTGMFRRKTRIWPLFVPAQSVAEIVCAENQIRLLGFVQIEPLQLSPYASYVMSAI